MVLLGEDAIRGADLLSRALVIQAERGVVVLWEVWQSNYGAKGDGLLYARSNTRARYRWCNEKKSPALELEPRLHGATQCWLALG